MDIRTTPLVVDGRVIFPVRDRAFAFDERTGLELWNYQATGWLTAASYADGRLFFGKSDNVGGVVCLNVSTGIEIWIQDNSPYFVMSSPLVNKGIV
ncbi:PQQ-binding-like beta-propeller repeat protein, partial [Candidatus Bathyarchaeota archaeon]|nr:PQQ-binding-like beta-propeller repeat protein [Candidatus Bathyarchaeota archaeon]